MGDVSADKNAAWPVAARHWVREQSARLYGNGVWVVVRASPWLAAGLALGIALIVAYVCDQQGDARVLGFKPTTAVAIAGSLLASALFGFTSLAVSALRRGHEAGYQRLREAVADAGGIEYVFDERGGGRARQQYDQLIDGARSRVWAIGMTLEGFTEQHADRIANLVGLGLVQDVKIAFWHPGVELVSDNFRRNILDIQQALETGNAPRGNDSWSDEVEARVQRIRSVVPWCNPRRGRFSVHYLRLATNVTCLVIDDRVFFFPFVSGAPSHAHPTIEAHARYGIGKAIVSHYERVLKDSQFAPCIWNNQPCPPQSGAVPPKAEAVLRPAATGAGQKDHEGPSR